LPGEKNVWGVGKKREYLESTKYEVHGIMRVACRNMRHSDTRVSLLRFGDALQHSALIYSYNCYSLLFRRPSCSFVNRMQRVLR